MLHTYIRHLWVITGDNLVSFMYFNNTTFMQNITSEENYLKTCWDPLSCKIYGNSFWNYSISRRGPWSSLDCQRGPQHRLGTEDSGNASYWMPTPGSTDAGLEWGRVHIPTLVQTHRKPCVHPRILTGTWWLHVRDSRCQRASAKTHPDWNEEQKPGLQLQCPCAPAKSSILLSLLSVLPQRSPESLAWC